MNPQDRVERVLKEIHVTFAKSPTYNGQPDKMIIDRRHFLNLLDRLNKGIFDMMEQYEQTRQSRQNAERAFKRKGEEIIDQANSSADDIYAASVIYTADAIGRIRDLMDQTNDSMNDLFRQFKRELKEQKDLLKSHESELESQLNDLADTKKYLIVLDEMNRERKRQNRDLEAEKAMGDQYARNMVHTPASQADVKVNEEYFEKSGKPTPEQREAKAAAPAEKPDVQVNKNAAYFKWRAEQEAKKAQEAGKDGDVATQKRHGKKQDVTEASAHRRRRDSEQEEKHPEEQPERTSGERTENWQRQPEEKSSKRRNEVAGQANAGVEEMPEAGVGTEHPNPEFPNEEAIMQAVLEDERRAMEETEAEGSESGGKKRGGVLKTIFFGDD